VSWLLGASSSTESEPAQPRALSAERRWWRLPVGWFGLRAAVANPAAGMGSGCPATVKKMARLPISFNGDIEQ
jgi:hypothetical protein